MKTYQVDITFRKGPGFGCRVIAMHEEDAKKLAAREAVGFGFDGVVKSYRVREVV